MANARRLPKQRTNEGARLAGMTWSHFTHAADLGLRGSGRTKAKAFEQIAMALTAAVTDVSLVKPSKRLSVHCAAPSDEVLLVDWLNALIYEMTVRKMLFSEFHVSLHDGELSASIAGESVDRCRHQPAVEVKGATFTALHIQHTADGWVVECVVDV